MNKNNNIYTFIIVGFLVCIIILFFIMGLLINHKSLNSYDVIVNDEYNCLNSIDYYYEGDINTSEVYTLKFNITNAVSCIDKNIKINFFKVIGGDEQFNILQVNFTYYCEGGICNG